MRMKMKTLLTVGVVEEEKHHHYHHQEKEEKEMLEQRFHPREKRYQQIPQRQEQDQEKIRDE